MYHWTCYLWLPHYFGKPQYIIYVSMCICSNSPKKLDELLTFSRSAFVKIIGTPARQWIYVFMISVGFFWIMEICISNIYLMQAVPFHHLQGVKMIKMLWCLRGTWASKNHPFVWPEKRETLSYFVHIQGFIFYIGIVYIYIYVVYTSEIWRSPALFCVCEIWKLGNLPKRGYFSYQLDQIMKMNHQYNQQHVYGLKIRC